jgi:hypothetical protein
MVACGLVVVVNPLCGAVSGLVGDGVIVRVSISCVRGVHVAVLSRTPGGAGLPCPPAEAAGGVKRSASAPSAASCEAGPLTATDVRSYGSRVGLGAEFGAIRTDGGDHLEVSPPAFVRVSVRTRGAHGAMTISRAAGALTLLGAASADMVSGSKSLQDQVAEIQKLIEDASDTLHQANWALETLRERLASTSDGSTPADLASADSDPLAASPDAGAGSPDGSVALDAGAAAGEPVSRRRHRRRARGAQGPPHGQPDA